MGDEPERAFGSISKIAVGSRAPKGKEAKGIGSGSAMMSQSSIGSVSGKVAGKGRQGCTFDVERTNCSGAQQVEWSRTPETLAHLIHLEILFRTEFL